MEFLNIIVRSAPGSASTPYPIYLCGTFDFCVLGLQRGLSSLHLTCLVLTFSHTHMELSYLGVFGNEGHFLGSTRGKDESNRWGLFGRRM